MLPPATRLPALAVFAALGIGAPASACPDWTPGSAYHVALRALAAEAAAAEAVALPSIAPPSAAPPASAPPGSYQATPDPLAAREARASGLRYLVGIRRGRWEPWAAGVARTKVEAAMRGGDREAWLVLGLMHATGLGVPHDPPRAFALVQAEALGGARWAEAVLGHMLEVGDGTPADLAAAAAWYRRASVHGLPGADLALGRLAAAVGDQATARGLFARAATAGHAPAMVAIGDATVRAPGGRAAALAWYQRAAEAGEPEAMRRLAEVHLAGWSSDRPAAGRWLERAALAGDDVAAVRLAELLASPDGDPARARFWLRAAADHGDAAAQVALAAQLATPGLVEAERVEAYRWLAIAAQAGHAGAAARLEDLAPRLSRAARARARFEVAQHFAPGEAPGRPWAGTPPDAAASLAWLRRAAEDGHVAAARLVAEHLAARDAAGMATLPPAAVRWYEQAAAGGEGAAMRRLAADHAARGERARAAAWTARAASADPEALYAAARERERRHEWVQGPPAPGDDDMVRAAYRRAADAGSAGAASTLGHRARAGKLGPRDPAAARGWFERAATLGDPWAAHTLAEMIARGEGGAADEAGARAWHIRGADLGGTGSLRHLGWLHEHGRGVARSPRLALTCYEAAAAREDPLAHLVLGDVYAAGTLGPADRAMAWMWYALAADMYDAAGTRLAALEPAMTPEELARARRLLGVYRSHHPRG